MHDVGILSLVVLGLPVVRHDSPVSREEPYDLLGGRRGSFSDTTCQIGLAVPAQAVPVYLMIFSVYLLNFCLILILKVGMRHA